MSDPRIRRVRPLAALALMALSLGLSGCFNPFSPRVAPNLGVAPPAPVAATDPTMPESGTDLTLKDAKERWMAVLEASYLRDLLARNDGNISAAAKAAGIDRKTFHRLINKHNLK